jgi:hypothetical protein
MSLSVAHLSVQMFLFWSVIYCLLRSVADSDKKSSGRSKASDEQEKVFTADPALLLAFIYFDQSHAGYLLDKDAEDILNVIGLQLSRAQVSNKYGVQELSTLCIAKFCRSACGTSCGSWCQNNNC